MQTTSAPAAAAIANVTLSNPNFDDDIQTVIICDRFDCVELAWRVVNNYPGWSIESVSWNR